MFLVVVSPVFFDTSPFVAVSPSQEMVTRMEREIQPLELSSLQRKHGIGTTGAWKTAERIRRAKVSEPTTPQVPAISDGHCAPADFDEKKKKQVVGIGAEHGERSRNLKPRRTPRVHPCQRSKVFELEVSQAGKASREGW